MTPEMEKFDRYICKNCEHLDTFHLDYPCSRCYPGHIMYEMSGSPSIELLIELLNEKDAALEEANNRIADIVERVNKLAARIGEGGYRQECVMDFAPFKDLHISRSYVPGHIILEMGNAIKDVDIYDLINKSGEKN